MVTSRMVSDDNCGHHPMYKESRAMIEALIEEFSATFHRWLTSGGLQHTGVNNRIGKPIITDHDSSGILHT